MAAVYLWLGVLIVLILGHEYLLSRMLKHRTTGRGLSWWRRYAFMTDATAFTDVGQIYRQEAIRLEAVLFVWSSMVLILVVIHDAMNIAATTGTKSLQ